MIIATNGNSQYKTDTIAAKNGTSNLVRSKVVFDGGNRTTAWVSVSGQVKLIPSIIKSLADWEDAIADDQSAVITYQGKKYVVGQQAKQLNGKAVFMGDKLELALELVLPALEPYPGESVVRIEELWVMLPDSRDADAIRKLKKLEGQHEFYLNGQHVLASVRKVVAIDETKGAYLHAMSKGLFQRPQSINGVIDIGGGTSIARLYSGSGALIRSADVILPGTNELAKKLNAALLTRTGKTQNLTLVMDAIADGSYAIGTTGISFADIFPGVLESWVSDIKDSIKNAWSEYFSQIGEVIIIGGSAPLLESLAIQTKNRFFVATDPQTFNLVGLSDV